MRSLFEQEVRDQLLERIASLTPESKGLWGKMDVSQMLKHVNNTMKIATGEVSLKTPPWHKRLMFRMFSPILYNDRPWKQNLPTAPELRVVQSEDIDKEKAALLETINKFLALPFPDGKMKHPVFGTFTKEQWGKMQFKHLDHHLRQFGV